MDRLGDVTSIMFFLYGIKKDFPIRSGAFAATPAQISQMSPPARPQFQGGSGRGRRPCPETRVGHRLRRHHQGIQAFVGKAGSFLFEPDSRPGKSDQREHCPLDLEKAETAPALVAGNSRRRNLHRALCVPRRPGLIKVAIYDTLRHSNRQPVERWLSGLKRTPGKREWA